MKSERAARAGIALANVAQRLAKQFEELAAHERRYGRGPAYWRKWKKAHKAHGIYAAAYNRLLAHGKGPVEVRLRRRKKRRS